MGLNQRYSMKKVPDVPVWTDVETAYIAGIIDGEGCLGLYPNDHGKGCQISLSITNTNKELIDWVADKIQVAKPNGYVPKNREWSKPLYHTSIWGSRAMEIIRRVRPYLKVKRKQADLMLAYYAWRIEQPISYLSPEQKANIWSFITQSRILNARPTAYSKDWGK